MSNITQLIDAAIAGDRQAASDLLPLIYEELRKLAAVRLAAEAPGNTLQPTALVHEAYLRLVGSNPQQPWNGRGHFFGAAAEAMRRILVDSARRKERLKRGKNFQRLDLNDLSVSLNECADELLDLDEALTQLAQEEPQKAELVKLRYFAGLTLEESANCLNISLASAKRYWTIARAWLFDALSKEKISESESHS